MNHGITIAVVTAGVSDPSSTRLLADRTSQRSVDVLRELGIPATITVVELAPIATDIARSLVGGLASDGLTSAIQRLAAADAIIVATPVYKAGISGLLKSFADLIDDDLLIAKPVVLAATGGTARHAMVVDEQLRPLFAFLRAIPVPTSLYAAPEDWGSTDLGTRITRAATELAMLVRSAVPRDIAEQNWRSYQHQFNGNATRTEKSSADVDFETDLMRLAAGGN
jgi:FMN reductase